MTPVVIVPCNIFDDSSLPSVAHSAMDLVEGPSVKTVRKTLEGRTLVRL